MALTIWISIGNLNKFCYSQESVLSFFNCFIFLKFHKYRPWTHFLRTLSLLLMVPFPLQTSSIKLPVVSPKPRVHLNGLIPYAQHASNFWNWLVAGPRKRHFSNSNDRSSKRRSKLTTVLIILIFMKVKKKPLVILVLPLVGLCTGNLAWTSSNPVLQRSERTLILLGEFFIPSPLILIRRKFFLFLHPYKVSADHLPSLMVGFQADFNAQIGLSPTRPITHTHASLIHQMPEDPHHHPFLLMSHLSPIHPPQAQLP